MKKIIAIFMVLAMSLGCAACAAQQLMEPEETLVIIEEDSAPEPSDRALEGDWYGYWEMFSCSGSWTEMNDLRWDCCAHIDAENEMLIWDEDMPRADSLAELELSSGGVSGGWFLDVSSGFEHWRLKMKQDDYGLLLTLRGSCYDPEYGDFSFVFYLRPWGDKWPEENRPERYDDFYLPMINKNLPIPDSFEDDDDE